MVPPILSVQFLLRWLFLVVLTLILFFQFKGIGETLSPWSQATINLISTLFYKTDGRDHSTVVLFRESDLENIAKIKSENLSYPLSYATHIEVLDALGRHHPKAILVDFSFMDQRPGDDVNELIKAFCELHHYKTKVYLSTFNYWQKNHGLREEIYLRSFNHDTSNGCYKIVPVEFAAEENGLVHTFNLWQNSKDDPALTIPSGVLEIYKDYVSIKNDSLISNKNQPSFKDQQSFKVPMDVVWGVRAPEVGRSDKPCSKFKLTETLFNLIKNGPMSLSRDCPYNNTLSVFSLFYETSDDVDALIADKLILYGGSFKGSSDVFNSPAHGEIPGVYLLAMALDNLNVYGADYKKIGKHEFSPINMPLMLDILIICLGVYWYLVGKSIKKVAFFNRSLVGRIYKFIDKKLLGNTKRLAKSTKVCVVEKVFDWSWVIFLFIFCIIFFLGMDYGPRNFWAFIVFLSTTNFIDTKLQRFQSIEFYKRPWIYGIAFLLVFCGAVYYADNGMMSNCWVFAFSVFVFLPLFLYVLFLFLSFIYRNP